MPFMHPTLCSSSDTHKSVTMGSMQKFTALQHESYACWQGRGPQSGKSDYGRWVHQCPFLTPDCNLDLKRASGQALLRHCLNGPLCTA